MSSTAATPARAPAIVVQDLGKRFGPQAVLQGLNLSIERGHTLALLGPNGTGKTTLLRILAGLLRPQKGTVKVFGETLPGSSSLRGRIGVVGHDGALYGDLSALENLNFFANIHGCGGPKAVELLKAVGLEDAIDRRTGDFSRGMIQRLALARALLHEPDLLLLDEPFSGLDPNGTAMVVALLAERSRNGTTVVLTTHNIPLAIEVADQVAVLAQGAIAWQAHTQATSHETVIEEYNRAVGRANEGSR